MAAVLAITAYPIPTGGAVRLQMTFASTANITLSRAISVGGIPGTFTQIYAGTLTPVYIDPGDGLPGPLDGGTFYVWQVSDGTSTINSDTVEPYSSLDILQEPLTAMIIRLMQAAINNLTPPPGAQGIQVLQAMPISGNPPMQFIVINPDLIQQQEIPVGQSVEVYKKDGTWVQTAFVRRLFRVSITCTNAIEREFYRDAVIAIWRSLNASVFAYLGLDVRHRFQATSGQIAKDSQLLTPGFFWCDVMCFLEGTMDISIISSFGIIEQIDTTANLPNGETVQTVVPVSGASGMI